jgi:hypothetical protein
MMLILGLVVGHIMAMVEFRYYKRYKAPIQRLSRQIESKTKPKADFISTVDSETEEWLETIKE